MKMKRFVTLLLVLSLLLGGVVVLRAEEEAVSVETEEAAPEVSMSGIRDVEYEYSYETVYENNEAILMLDRSISSFRVVSKETGLYYDTKTMTGQAGSNETIKNYQKSDFLLTYYFDKIKSSTRTLDNYSMSIALDQVAYETLDNGVRVKYTLGEGNQVQLTMFPMFISKDRMEELVLQHLSDAQKRELLEHDTQSYYVETETRYVRRWNTYDKDKTFTKVPKLKLNSLYKMFYETGEYTIEELEFDNAEWGEETIDSSISFEVNMDYTLDGKDLVVSLPVDEIVVKSMHPEKNPVCGITLNPYLMSGDVFDDGYLFLPDGSGGIINFNNGKSSAPVLQMPVYGSDVLYEPHYYKESFAQTTLPVYGMKKNNLSLLAVIEEGAEIATLSANVSGKVDEYNKVNAAYDILYMEKLPVTLKFGNDTPLYASSSYAGTLTTRYIMVENGSGYTGMAKAYKDYLIGQGELKQNDTPDNAPFFVDFIGTVPISKSFFGIGYTSYPRLTGFDDAIDILKSLQSNGVENIVAQYSSWANGGFYNDPYTSFKVIGGIGGKSGLNRLLEYAKSSNAEIYPVINFLTVNSTKGISKNRDVTRTLNNESAYLPSFNLVTRQSSSQYLNMRLLSPSYLNTYAEKILKGMDKLKLDNISLSDAGTLLYGNYYRKNQIMRYDALDYFKDSLAALDADSNVMFSNANSYAYQYAAYITDLPTDDSLRRVLDYGVPFTQMVLENEVPYSMEAYNNNTMSGIEAYMLKAVETKSSLKFTLTNSDESYFTTTFGINDYFETQYARWEDKIGSYYKEYNDFYQKVKNAEITGHEKNGDAVKVTYSNGVKVYLNYGTAAVSMDGNEIAPLTYLLTE